VRNRAHNALAAERVSGAPSSSASAIGTENERRVGFSPLGCSRSALDSSSDV
jgi:hypothetical protein